MPPLHREDAIVPATDRAGAAPMTEGPPHPHDFRHGMAQIVVLIRYGFLIALGAGFGAMSVLVLLVFVVILPLAVFGIEIDDQTVILLAGIPGSLWGAGIMAMIAHKATAAQISKLEEEGLARWTARFMRKHPPKP